MLEINQITLLAADDWWQVIGTIIVFLFYGIGHLISGREERQKKARRAQRPPVAQPAGEVPPNQADPLRAEVEDFLRRAEGKQPQPADRQEAKPRPVPQRSEPIAREPAHPTRKQPPVARPVGSPEPKARSPKSRAASRAPQRKTPEETVEPRREGVGEHVARHLSSERVTQRAEKLGQEVALADDIVEARLEEKFEHRLGSLKQKEAQVEEAAPTIAEEVRKLISQPAGMRQVIVANEILRRPEQRW